MYIHTWTHTHTHTHTHTLRDIVSTWSSIPYVTRVDLSVSILQSTEDLPVIIM